MKKVLFSIRLFFKRVYLFKFGAKLNRGYNYSTTVICFNPYSGLRAVELSTGNHTHP
jgi:hypothetical protein